MCKMDIRICTSSFIAHYVSKLMNSGNSENLMIIKLLN